jgi:hypothetical protein
MAVDDLWKRSKDYLKQFSVGGESPSQEQRQEKLQEHPQDQPQKQVRGQRVTAERVTTESKKDVEAAMLNASVEGLGFFRLQLGPEQSRPAGAAQPTQESPKARGSLYWIILGFLGGLTLLLFIAAVVFLILHLVQGKHTSPFVSTSYQVINLALIGTLLTLGGVTLVSLEIGLNRLNNRVRQVEASQRIEREERAEEQRKPRPPELVIENRGRLPQALETRDDTIKAALAKLLENRNELSHENWTIKWTEKCFEDEEIQEQIKEEINRLDTGRRRVVKLIPDPKPPDKIAFTYETEYRIPV